MTDGKGIHYSKIQAMRKRITFSRRHSPGRPYIVLWVLAVAAAILAHLADPFVFNRFLGGIHPALVLLLSGILGYGCLIYLNRIPGFQALKMAVLKNAGIPLTGAILFGCIAICLDLLFQLPEDLNVPFPVSLVFYPSIGFVAEIMFHVVPVTMLIACFQYLRIFPREEMAVRTSLFIAATAEPLYQVLAMLQTELIDNVTVLVLGLHILIISLIQLWVFRQNGFLYMYLFRLIYYMIWHIAWGHLRLQVLFAP